MLSIQNTEVKNCFIFVVLRFHDYTLFSGYFQLIILTVHFIHVALLGRYFNSRKLWKVIGSYKSMKLTAKLLRFQLNKTNARIVKRCYRFVKQDRIAVNNDLLKYLKL